MSEPVYTIKGYKSFIGNEGHGYNLTLCRDGVKVAFVIDDASGGEVDFQWADRGKHKDVEVPTRDGKGVAHLFSGTPEEAKLYAFLKGKMTPPMFEGDTERQTTPDIFVAGLIDALEKEKAEQKLWKLCRTCTLIRITGDAEDAYRVVKAPLTDKVRAALTAQAKKSGKEVIEWINDALAKKYGGK